MESRDAIERDEVGLLKLLEEAELAVDHGNLISGPFIPDGTVRIYRPETLSILGRGATLVEAVEDLPSGVVEFSRSPCRE